MTPEEIDAFKTEQQKQTADHKRQTIANASEPAAATKSEGPSPVENEIGVWKDDGSPVFVIYMQLVDEGNGRITVIKTARDGSTERETHNWDGTRIPAINPDEYFKYENGRLSSFDGEGFIETLPKIR